MAAKDRKDRKKKTNNESRAVEASPLLKWVFFAFFRGYSGFLFWTRANRPLELLFTGGFLSAVACPVDSRWDVDLDERGSAPADFLERGLPATLRQRFSRQLPPPIPSLSNLL
jgi:hypothetical protein